MTTVDTLQDPKLIRRLEEDMERCRKCCTGSGQMVWLPGDAEAKIKDGRCPQTSGCICYMHRSLLYPICL